jgi:hypothetical protein
MIAFGVQFDRGELDAFAGRVRASIRHFGSAELARTLQEWGVESNRRDALAGLDRHGKGLVPTWKTRKGRSDYHGRNYAAFNNATTLIPFGRASRRIDAFDISIRRRSVAGIVFGGVAVSAGFSPRAGLIPSYWRRRGWDVLGMSPRTQEGYRRLLNRHATASHRLLKRSGGQVGRAAAAFF